MDKITIKDVLKAIKFADANAKEVSSLSQYDGEKITMLSSVGDSELKIWSDIERYIVQADSTIETINKSYYFGTIDDVERAGEEIDNLPRLEIEEDYVRLMLDEDLMLSYSISNPNDSYNLIENLWSNAVTTLRPLDDSVDIKAVFTEIIERSSEEETIERTKNALSFLDNFMEVTLEKDVNRDAKITRSLQSIQTKGRDERKGVIKGLMAEYDFKKLSEYLSDDDLEVVAEIKEEEITANDSIIGEKKDRINVLTRREQLMKKLASQEEALKSQESQIKSLDNDIKRLESRQGQK